jgi:hypothetical protein
VANVWRVGEVGHEARKIDWNQIRLNVTDSRKETAVCFCFCFPTCDRSLKGFLGKGITSSLLCVKDNSGCTVENGLQGGNYERGILIMRAHCIVIKAITWTETKMIAVKMVKRVASCICICICICVCVFSFLFFLFFVVLEMEPRASCIRDKHCH